MEFATIKREERETYRSLSLDTNPLHLDGDYAKYTQFGSPVVYGALVLEKILERYPGFSAEAFQCEFLSPVFYEKTYTIVSDSDHISVHASGGQLCCRLALANTAGSSAISDFSVSKGQALAPRLSKPRAAPLRFNDLLNFDWYREEQKCRDIKLLIRFSSYLIGMLCPGEHSIFRSIYVSRMMADFGSNCLVREKKVSEKFGIFNYELMVPGWYAEVTAVSRHPPMRLQYSPAKLEKKLVLEEGVVFVILGAARGLGRYLYETLLYSGAQVYCGARQRFKEKLDNYFFVDAIKGKYLFPEIEMGVKIVVINCISPKILRNSGTSHSRGEVREYLIFYWNPIAAGLDAYADHEIQFLNLSTSFLNADQCETRRTDFSSYMMAKAIVERRVERKRIGINARIGPQSTDQNVGVSGLTEIDTFRVMFELLATHFGV